MTFSNATKTIRYFCLCIALTSNAHAQNQSKENLTLKKFSLRHVSFGAGNYSEFDHGVQNSKSGSIRGFDFAPYISTSASFYLTPRISLVPELSYVLQRNAENSSIKKNIFWIKSDLAFNLLLNTRLRLGTGWVINSISGNGGSEKLNNGSDDNKDTYYLPSDRRTVVNQTFDVGIDHFFSPEISIKYGVQIFSFFDINRTQQSSNLILYYHLPMH